jgi:hypothetical protein
LVGLVRPVAHQAAGDGILALEIDRRNGVARSEVDLPVQLPSTFECAVNLTTLKTPSRALACRRDTNSVGTALVCSACKRRRPIAVFA